MYKVKVNLVTMSDVKEFVDIISGIDAPVKLTDSAGCTVNAKSIIGCLAALEWNQLFTVSDVDIYSKIEKFAM